MVASRTFENPLSEDSEVEAAPALAAPGKILDVETFDGEGKDANKTFESAGEETSSRRVRGSFLAFEEDNVTETARTPVPSFRERMFLFLDVPGSSAAATAFGTVILLLIVASCACFVLETHEHFKSRPRLISRMQIIEVVCIVTFTVEYIIRLCCCNARPSPNAVGAAGVLRYMMKPMNLIDLLAIAPFWVEKLFLHAGANTEVVRMARMTRIFRVFKTSSYASELTLFYSGMRRAKEGLVILFFLLALYLCVFGVLLYVAEYDTQRLCLRPEVSSRSYEGTSCPAQVGFTSVPTAWYFILATLTTVGYGDMYPITNVGKILTGLCMGCGILVIGLPIIVITMSFDDAFKSAASDALTREQKATEKKRLAQAQKQKLRGDSTGSDAPVARRHVPGLAPDSPKQYFKLLSADPSIDVLVVVRSLMRTLDQLHMKTGDKRFASARRALTAGLDGDLHKDFNEGLFDPFRFDQQ